LRLRVGLNGWRWGFVLGVFGESVVHDGCLCRLFFADEVGEEGFQLFFDAHKKGRDEDVLITGYTWR
jgi:hypothetical protein